MRQIEKRESPLIGRHAPLDLVGKKEHDDQSCLIPAGVAERPHAEASPASNGGVPRMEEKPEAPAEASELRHQRNGHGDNSKRRSRAQEQDLGFRDVRYRRRFASPQGGIAQIDTGHHDVVEDGGESRKPELPVRLQRPGHDHRRSVEDHLGREQAQEGRPQLDLLGPEVLITYSKGQELHDERRAQSQQD
jgi:hypothetical protein